MTAPEIVGFGEVDDDGKFLLYDRGPFFEALAREFKGSKVELRARRFTRKRSRRQNNFYWAVITKLLSDHTGYSPQECHETLKKMFLSQTMFFERPDESIVEVEIPGSSASLTKEEFTEYIQRCEVFLAELGIEIPEWEGDKYVPF